MTRLKVVADDRIELGSKRLHRLETALASLNVQVMRTRRGRVMLDVPDQPEILEKVGQVLVDQKLSYEPVEVFTDTSPLTAILAQQNRNKKGE